MKDGHSTSLPLPPRRAAVVATAWAMLAMSASFAGAVRGQDFTFGPPVDYPAPVPVTAIAIGDVNGDRLDDMVTFAPPYEQQAQRLLIHLQAPDGTLAAPFAVDVGDAAAESTVGIADFNKDGANDIAVGMGYGITMLLGDGQGGFAMHQYADGHVSTVEQIADIDSDGRLDILSTGIAEISILLGDGHGSFHARTALPAESTLMLAYGDVSGDGHGDIVAMSPTSFSVAKGDGLGHFQAPVDYPGPDPQDRNGALAIGDFSGDARMEVAIAEQSSPTDFHSIRIYSQDDNGDLLPPAYLASRPFGASAAIARDVDGDGRDDLLVYFDGEMGLYLHDATGLPENPELFDMDFIVGFASGDLDDDGCTDVALAYAGISVLHGLNCVPRRVASDFDADGVSDLLWRNTATGANVIWKSADAGTQQAVTRVADTDWSIVGVGDFDGDDKADIVWHHRLTGAGTIWKSGDYGTQQALVRITDPAWNIVGVGDFDGDGKDDLLWRHAASGRNAIWKSGNYYTQQAVTGVTDVDWNVAGVGDFDADGRADILWRHDVTGVNAIWKAGSYHMQQSIAAVTNVDWRVAGIADFDGDGLDDVFWRSEGGANTIWRSAAYARQVPMPAQPTRWIAAAAADYDGDGDDDLFWRNTLDGSNVIWRSGAAADIRGVAQVPNQSWVIRR